jgi:hypothetical protein
MCLRSADALPSRPADDEDPLDWNVSGHAALYVYATVDSKDNDLISIGCMRKIPHCKDSTLFFPLIPPPKVVNVISSVLQRPPSVESTGGRESFFRPPAMYSLGPEGAVMYHVSSGGRTRHLQCVPRQHVADILYKVNIVM